MPPLTAILAPVMKPDSSATKNVTNLATSSGLPKRPTEIWLVNFLIIILTNGSNHVCINLAGRDCIDGDPKTGRFKSQCHGKAMHTRFCLRVDLFDLVSKAIH